MAMELSESGSDGQRFPFPKIRHRAPPKSLPLSVSQKLWIESGLVPHQDQWLPIVWRMEGRLDVSTFVRSFGRLTHRHNILRTRILKRDEAYVQEIDPVQEVRLALVSLEAIPPDRQEYEVHDRLKSLLDRRPALESGFIHLQLFRLRSDLHILGGFIHNAAMDAASLKMFFQELMEGYFREVEGRPGLLAGPLQHSDFVLWEAEWLTPEQIAEADQVWTRRLAGAEPLRLPKGRMFGDPVTSWASERLLMPSGLHDDAVKYASAKRVSLSAVFYAALSIALARWSGQDSVLFGSVLSGRPAGFRAAMGSFTQIRPFFVSLRGNPSLSEFIAEAGRALVAAHDMRTPISASILRRLSVGNVLVNYARSATAAGPPGDARPDAGVQKRNGSATAGASRSGSPQAQRAGQITRSNRTQALSASSDRRRDRPPQAINGDGGHPRPATLRAGPSALPKPLAPEFSRDLYFNMLQAPDGVHGLVTYSDVRHKQARMRQLIDHIFSIMAVMNTAPDKKVSSVR
jgi:hypothetical protein